MYLMYCLGSKNLKGIFMYCLQYQYKDLEIEIYQNNLQYYIYEVL